MPIRLIVAPQPGLEPGTYGLTVQSTPRASAKICNGFLPVGVSLPNLLPNAFGPVEGITIRFFYVNQRNGDADRRTLADRPHGGEFQFRGGPPSRPARAAVSDRYAACACTLGTITDAAFAASCNVFEDKWAYLIVTFGSLWPRICCTS